MFGYSEVDTQREIDSLKKETRDLREKLELERSKVRDLEAEIENMYLDASTEYEGYYL